MTQDGEMSREHVTREINYARVVWQRVVLATLRQRGVLKPGAPAPQTNAAVLPDRVIFFLDMAKLGGVRREQWLNPDLIAQLRAASGGCRVVVTDSAGLAVQIGRQPVKRLVAPRPLPEMAEFDLSLRPRPAYSVGFGVGRQGPIWAPLTGLGHVMVSGSTGSGKSYFLRSLAYQLINLPPTGSGRQRQVELHLADPKGNVFTPLKAYKVPQLAAPVAKTEAEVVELLEKAVAEMGRRERLFDAQVRHFPDKLEEYNRVEGVEPLPRVVVIVDEVTVLVGKSGQRGLVHRALLELAAQGRKYGFTLIVAGQDFKANTFEVAR
jgi:S-DNA-T family DNA segregation ATPase FtsK/SpoIIIE